MGDQWKAGIVLNMITLRKLAHAINRDFLAVKIENLIRFFFYIYIFLIFAQNLDCGYP